MRPLRWHAVWIGFLAGASAVALLAGCGTVTSSARAAAVHHFIDESYAYYAGSLSELVALPATTDIVEGSVAGVAGRGLQAGASPADQPYPYTDFDITVTRWLKGSGASSIVIHQIGGTGADGSQWLVDGDPLLSVGSENVFFLHLYAPGKYFIVAGPTGRFPVINGEVTAMSQGTARDGVPESVPAFVQRVKALVASSSAAS